MSSRKNKIQTVLGLIEPDDVGFTLCHEHLFLNAEPLRLVPFRKDADRIRKLPFKLENYGVIREFYNSNDENLLMNDYAAIVEEMLYYKANGGSAVVDCTILGLEPRVELLKSVAEKTGVHISAGSGYYFDSSHTEAFRASCSVESKYNYIKSQILDGVGTSGVKCGHIGEIGCSFPLTSFEKSSLLAAAMVQQELGAPLTIHPGREPTAPCEIARILLEAGASKEKIILGHMDRTMQTNEEFLTVLEYGTLIAFDLFGLEVSWYPVKPQYNVPSDGQRVDFVKFLLDQGFEDHIVLGHDIWTKHRLTKYGGHGFSHLLLNIIPRMKFRGVSESQIDKMMIYNIRNWLTFTK